MFRFWTPFRVSLTMSCILFVALLAIVMEHAGPMGGDGMYRKTPCSVYSGHETGMVVQCAPHATCRQVVNFQEVRITCLYNPDPDDVDGGPRDH